MVIATPKFNWIGGFVPSKSVSKDYITGYIWAFEERALLNENIEIYFLVKGTWKIVCQREKVRNDLALKAYAHR